MGEEDAVMNSVCSFLDFLATKLELNGVGSTLKEDITPVLSVLYNMARALRPVRKYLKTTILPPLQVAVEILSLASNQILNWISFRQVIYKQSRRRGTA